MFRWIRSLFNKEETIFEKSSKSRVRLKNFLSPELFDIVNKQLNDDQIIVYENLMYFLDDDKNGHHREKVLCMFFLTQAYKFKNVPIYVFSHHPSVHCRRDIICLLKRILANYPELKEYMIMYESSIMYEDLKEK